MRLYKIGVNDRRDVYGDGDKKLYHVNVHIRADSLQAAKDTAKKAGAECFPPDYVKLHDHYWNVDIFNGIERVECVKDRNPYVWSGDSSVSYKDSQGVKEAWIPIGEVEEEYQERTRIESIELELERLLRLGGLTIFTTEELENAFPSYSESSPISPYNIPMSKKITEGGVRLSPREAGGCRIESVEVFFPEQLNTHLGWPDESHLFEMMHPDFLMGYSDGRLCLEKFERWILFVEKRWSDMYDDCPEGSRSYGPFEVPVEGARRIAEAYGYRGNLDNILSKSPDELRP